MSFTDLMPWSKKQTAEVKPEAQEHPIASFHRDINKVFDNFFSDFSFPSLRNTEELWNTSFSPKVNVSENEKEINVEAELPGMEEKDVNVTLNNNSLVIKGERKSKKEDKSDNYHLVESSYGSFCRTIPIPEGIDRDKIEAVYKNGVMKVTIPKTEEAKKKVKKIPIKTN